jgi:hypothetical protein
LPTAAAKIDGHAEPLFADYRAVPWLARSHAITLLPSASALRTLRKLPAGSDQRERLVGFGDPLFNAEQAAEIDHPHLPVQVASGPRCAAFLCDAVLRRKLTALIALSLRAISR